MQSTEFEELFAKGIAAVDQGDTVCGMLYLEKLIACVESPLLSSYFAVCLAKEREDYEEAFALLGKSQGEEPGEPVHYLNLGRVHLARGAKREAIRAFRDGLLFGEHPGIRGELRRIGWRNPRVFPRLPREHFLNRYLGYIGTRFGFR